MTLIYTVGEKMTETSLMKMRRGIGGGSGVAVAAAGRDLSHFPRFAATHQFSPFFCLQMHCNVRLYWATHYDPLSTPHHPLMPTCVNRKYVMRNLWWALALKCHKYVPTWRARKFTGMQCVEGCLSISSSGRAHDCLPLTHAHSVQLPQKSRHPHMLFFVFSCPQTAQ